MKEEDLIFDKAFERRFCLEFTFKNNDAIVRIQKNSKFFSCTCHNGSNCGVNNKQLCYHKKFIIHKMNLKEEMFLNKQNNK